MNLPTPEAYTTPAKGTKFTTGDIIGLPRAEYAAQRHALDFVRTITLTVAENDVRNLHVVKLRHPIRLAGGIPMAIFDEKKPNHGPRKAATTKKDGE